MHKNQTDSYELFKPLRNLICKYDALSLVISASKRIHEIENKPSQQWLIWHPWYLLLLIKWSLQYGGGKYPPKPVTEKALINLHNKIHLFDDECGSSFLNNENSYNTLKFFRTLAIQQFWLQTNVGSWDLARQYILFCDLSCDHLIQTQFTKTYNITMNQFLEMSFLLWSWLTKSISNTIFEPGIVFNNLALTNTQIQNYFNVQSLSPSDIVTFLSTNTKFIKDPCLQLKEISPFLDKPILTIGKKMLVYSQRLFEKNISEFFYNQVKTIGGSKACDLFARKLEMYVENSLKSVGLPFLCEKDIKSNFPGGKVPDFLITLPNCTIILEVKSFETKPYAQVYPENRVLINELEDSVIKATIQGLSLATKLAKDNKNNSKLSTLPPFLMILTYKDLYLGDGQSIWDEFLFTAVNSSNLNQEMDLHAIPADHIIILSIKEFDLLMSCVYRSQATLEKILRAVVINNQNSQSRKLMFSQHLDQFVPTDLSLPYLENAFNELSSKVESKFSLR